MISIIIHGNSLTDSVPFPFVPFEILGIAYKNSKKIISNLKLGLKTLYYSETLEFNAYQIEIESNRIETKSIESKRTESNRNESNRNEPNRNEINRIEN